MTNAHSKETKPVKYGRYIRGECFYNAWYNQQNKFYQEGLDLKIVIGSLGLNGHFEYGGKNWKMKEFKKCPNDSHAWLEDSEGNVYDYIFSYYGECATYFGKTVTFPLEWEIVGIPKQALKEEYRLEYVPAPPQTQEMIMEHIKSTYKLRFQMGWLEKVQMELGFYTSYESDDGAEYTIFKK